jgi:acylphosphatase
MGACARHVIVSGAVQGVGFRHYTKVRARELGLTGWVQNLDDGRVEVWVEGAEPVVERMVAWLRSGPPSARVSAIDARAVEPARLERFEVRR